MPRVAAAHAESALDAGDGEVTETSDLDHIRIGLALCACPGAASATRATRSDSAQRLTDADLECSSDWSMDEAERLAAF